jgi:hypothetical protein
MVVITIILYFGGGPPPPITLIMVAPLLEVFVSVTDHLPYKG